MIGWVVIPGTCLTLLAWLRRRNLHSVRLGTVLLAGTGTGMAFFLFLADGAPVAESLVAGLVLAVGGALFALLLFVAVKALGNDIPW